MESFVILAKDALRYFHHNLQMRAVYQEKIHVHVYTYIYTEIFVKPHLNCNAFSQFLFIKSIDDIILISLYIFEKHYSRRVGN